MLQVCLHVWVFEESGLIIIVPLSKVLNLSNFPLCTVPAITVSLVDLDKQHLQSGKLIISNDYYGN